MGSEDRTVSPLAGWQGASLPVTYVQKVVETGTSLHRGPLGNLEGALYARDVKR